MPQVQSIRRLRRNGESVASIARKTHISEPTVCKYLAKEDLSAVPASGKPRALAVGPVFARGRSSGSRRIVRTGASSGIPRPGSGSGRGTSMARRSPCPR